MDTLAIFGLQFLLSLVVWGLIAKWLLAPWLEKKSPHDALFWLTPRIDELRAADPAASNLTSEDEPNG